MYTIYLAPVRALHMDYGYYDYIVEIYVYGLLLFDNKGHTLTIN